MFQPWARPGAEHEEGIVFITTPAAPEHVKIMENTKNEGTHDSAISNSASYHWATDGAKRMWIQLIIDFIIVLARM